MASVDETAVPKVHPASREMLPDDPLEMHGFEVPGDPELMLRLLVEEYARMGWGMEAILAVGPRSVLSGVLRPVAGIRRRGAAPPRRRHASRAAA